VGSLTEAVGPRVDSTMSVSAFLPSTPNARNQASSQKPIADRTSRGRRSGRLRTASQSPNDHCDIGWTPVVGGRAAVL
jgi:hypothetical protein